MYALCFFTVNKLHLWRLLLKLHSVSISTLGWTDLVKHKVGKNKMCEPMPWEKRHPVFCKDSTEWAFLTIFIYARFSTLPRTSSVQRFYTYTPTLYTHWHMVFTVHLPYYHITFLFPTMKHEENLCCVAYSMLCSSELY